MRGSRSHPGVLHTDDALVVVVDMQEPFLRTIHLKEQLVERVRVLLQGAAILRLPIISTTQYAERMGGVVSEIKRLLPQLRPPFDKMTFSCWQDTAFASEVERSGRRQIVLCGIETHICVSQTAHELIAAGYAVHVVADAVSSRTEFNWRIGLERMRDSGAVVTSVEMGLFELLHESGTPEFKQILNLIK